ncbi:MAG: glycosyltransferase [Kiritimatiellae bacterium]|nr:glycosyltransferase [Kiritimatiellia bacterium]
MINVKVSVVVPVYQVASYIERCAVSLFEQTLPEMQFIFVDDGSPDESCAILERVLLRYPERAEQTLILHHGENRGLPAARETGLRHATGEYVAHCDSDDWVEREMYATLYASAKSNDADMVLCDSFVEKSEGDPSQWRQSLSPDGDWVRYLLHRKLIVCVWCRLTRTAIYRKVQFPQKSYLEDWVQTVQVLAYSKIVNLVHQPLYHYCFNPDSISRIGWKKERCLESLSERTVNFALMHDFVIGNALADEDDLITWKIQVRSILLPLLAENGKYRSLYLNTYPEINWRLLFSRHVSRTQKVSFLAIFFNLFPLLCKLQRWRSALARWRSRFRVR